jgi:hypothetical protein
METTEIKETGTIILTTFNKQLTTFSQEQRRTRTMTQRWTRTSTMTRKLRTLIPAQVILIYYKSTKYRYMQFPL